jgi:hypothetical protein
VTQCPAGPGSRCDNVTVVVADKTRPDRVQDAFEAMLGLPSAALDPPRMRASITNRSFSAKKASLFLQINRTLPEAR